MWVKQKVSHNVTTICPLNGDWIFFSELKIHFHFFHSVQRSCMVTWESSFVEPCFTRLHSSRMHTARLFTISPSMHCTGGSAPGGGGCLVLGGVRSGGWMVPGGQLRGGGAWSGGVSQHALRQTPYLWTEFLTQATELMKILPFPKLRLRAVNIYLYIFHLVYISNETNGNVSKILTFKTFLSIGKCWQNWPSYVYVKGMKMEVSQSIHPILTYFLPLKEDTAFSINFPRRIVVVGYGNTEHRPRKVISWAEYVS